MARDREAGRQGQLFGEPVPEKGGPRVGAAPVPEELERIADELPDNLYLGTSSWSFPGWKGLVFDRSVSKATLAREGLAAYARHRLLRAVGIDRTYYAPISAEAFAEYAAVVPDSFRFLVKASGECTSPRRRAGGRNELFLDAGYAADQVVAPFVEGLGKKAGPLVFQFPPLGRAHTGEPARFATLLEEFLRALPSGPWYAVELRDRELFGPEYLDALESAGARHCLNVHPRMPSVAEQARPGASRSSGPLVVRWMLHAGLDYEAAQRRYEPFSRLVDEDTASRSVLAGLCAERAGRADEIVIVANNKAEGSAPLTVFRLAERIAERLRGESV